MSSDFYTKYYLSGQREKGGEVYIFPSKSKIDTAFLDKMKETTTFDKYAAAGLVYENQAPTLDTPSDEVVDDTPSDEVVDDTPSDEVVDDTPSDEVVDDTPSDEVVDDTPSDEVVDVIAVLEVMPKHSPAGGAIYDAVVTANGQSPTRISYPLHTFNLEIPAGASSIEVEIIGTHEYYETATTTISVDASGATYELNMVQRTDIPIPEEGGSG